MYKTIVPGHEYELPNEGGVVLSKDDSVVEEPPANTLRFLRKEFNEDGSLRKCVPGTTNEAVLGVLIDRLKDMNIRVPSRQTSLAITKLEEALLWLEHRTRERIARGIEGTPAP